MNRPGDVVVRLRVPRRVDVTMAGVVGVAAIGGTVAAGAGQGAPRQLGLVGCLLILVAAGGWSWWRGAPVWSWAVVTAATAAYVFAGYPYGPIQLFVMMAGYAVARHRSAGTAIIAGAMASVVLGAALWTRLDDSSHLAVTAIVPVAWPSVFVVIPALFGALVRMRAAATARERAELVARGAYEERLRVAREVHDTAGHGFAVVSMHAGVALTMFDERPEQARASLEAIRVTSDQALRELHATLDTFTDRAENAEPTGDLAALIERLRAGGLAVEFAVEGAPDGFDSPVLMAVYRVVQESLTNVVRHAGTMAANVAVRYRPDEVTVLVTDNGGGATGPTAGRPGGRGLAGIRERVERLGGALTASDRAGRGFEVSARIPALGRQQ